MKNNSDQNPGCCVVYLSTFPPRQCGIATFTDDLLNAINGLFYPAIQSKVIAMNANNVDTYQYSQKVIYQINQEDIDQYIHAAQYINSTEEIRLVNIQHEFGIFGGEYGYHLVSFLKALKKPSIITFHTVLPNPNKKLLSVVKQIAKHVNAIIVMTKAAKEILINDYSCHSNKIQIIPHGIHARPYVNSQLAKEKLRLGYENRTVLSTFGLLSRGKGIEYVIAALPKVIKKYPNIIYIVFGMTHPNILKQEGESYRKELMEKIINLGLEKHVKFYNKYFSINDLLDFLEMTDIYISTSLNPNQAVSGTLTYALGAGRAVISTAFIQAKEEVGDDCGLLVDFNNSRDYAKAIIKLLDDENLINLYGKHAYAKSRHMLWQNVALQYINVFSEQDAVLLQQKKFKTFPKIKLDHLLRLTDEFGIIQFAQYAKPDLHSGYTLDDNARALIVVSDFYQKVFDLIQKQVKKYQPFDEVARQYNLDKRNISSLDEVCNEIDNNEEYIRNMFGLQGQELISVIKIYLKFIAFCMKENGSFENYVTYNKTFDHKANQKDSLEDSNARAIYTLAFATTRSFLPKNIRTKAFELLEKSLLHAKFQSPRSIAFYIKALCLLITKKKTILNIDAMALIKQYAERLVSMYEAVNTPDWPWFETSLTYANAILSEALFSAYKITEHKPYLEIAEKTLSFLITVHFKDDLYVPIGQDGWYHKQGQRNYFDQQPEDVTAMVLALETAYLITHNDYYKKLMHKTFCWFLGDNLLGQMVYDPSTAGCYDGLGKNNVNLNQGAESTISYLLAKLAWLNQKSITRK